MIKRAKEARLNRFPHKRPRAAADPVSLLCRSTDAEPGNSCRLCCFGDARECRPFQTGSRPLRPTCGECPSPTPWRGMRIWIWPCRPSIKPGCWGVIGLSSRQNSVMSRRISRLATIKKPKRKASVFYCSSWREPAGHYFLMRITGVSPTVTAPVILINSLISSMLEMTTGVRVDLAFASRTARSNSMMVSPRLTC